MLTRRHLLLAGAASIAAGSRAPVGAPPSQGSAESRAKWSPRSKPYQRPPSAA